MSEVAEKTADVVEEAIDGVVDVVEVVRNNPRTLILVGVLGAAAGGAGGYFIAVHRLGKQFDERLAAEIEETKEFYAGLYKTDTDGAVLTPQSVMADRHGADAAAEAVRGYQGRKTVERIIEEESQEVAIDEQDEELLAKTETKAMVVEETRNVFVDPNFDLEEELRHRSADKPYIITHDEYFQGDKDYEQSSLTYFEMDDTLTNEKDEPLREIDKLIGEDHLVRFGHGSKDKNIVYVRNDRLGVDYEIIKSTGSYLEEVLGMPGEPGTLKHSDQRDRRRAFRHGDG